MGIAPFISGQWALKIMKFPEGYANASTLVMTRLFGVRDIGLGILTLMFMSQPASLTFLLVLNFCMDAGDVFSYLLAWRSDSNMKTAALNSGGVAFLAVIFWTIALALQVF